MVKSLRIFPDLFSVRPPEKPEITDFAWQLDDPGMEVIFYSLFYKINIPSKEIIKVTGPSKTQKGKK